MPVSLEQVLDSRDRRAERQAAALGRFGLPLVSVTIVMPGAVKDSPLSRSLLTEARSALDHLFADSGWAVRLSQSLFEPTGPEALYAVEAEAQTLKRAMVALEDQHPLGRLWDLDVHCPRAGSLSRRSLGLRPRPCLVCDDDAHACARSQRHPLPYLLKAITEKIHAYGIPLSG